MFSHACLALFSAFCVFPLVWIFLVSVSGANTMVNTGDDPFSFSPGLSRYTQILSDPAFILWLKNSLLLALSSAALPLFTAFPAAYAFSRLRFAGRKTVLYLLIFFAAFPGILSAAAYLKLLSFMHLVDSRAGLVLLYSGGVIVFSVWNIKAFIDSVPQEYDESAMMDGAGHFVIMTKILFPLCAPTAAANAFLSFLFGWNEYIFAMTFIVTPENLTAPVGLWSLQSPGVIGGYALNWPLFAAGSVIVSVPAIAASFFFLMKADFGEKGA